MTMRLKYLSMKLFIGVPNFQMSHPTRKKRRPRPMTEASMNMPKLMWNTPAARVKILYGIGVKPAVKTAQKFHSS